MNESKSLRPDVVALQQRSVAQLVDKINADLTAGKRYSAPRVFSVRVEPTRLTAITPKP
jgi:hypothetical protein